MSNAAPVQLRQVRDFEQTLGDAIAFVRQNGAVLVRAVVLIAIVPMVLYGAVNGWMLLYPSDPAPTDIWAVNREIWSTVGIMYIPFAIGRALVNCVTLQYLRAYLLKEHRTLTTSDLLVTSLRGFLPYLVILVFTWGLGILGAFLCILPGLYLLNIFVLTGVVFTVERSGVGNAIGRSVSLAHSGFWPLLGLCTSLVVVSYLLSLAFNLPALLFSGIEEFWQPGFDGSPDLPMWKVVISSAWTSIAGILQEVVHTVVVVAISLRYFSIVERSQGVGLKEKLAGFDTVA
ncbi:MAG: hypothetical protein IPJ76_16730 [Flavobacteriales bacterium]|nr:MAG: hypothetical protein IPJ76_16730 [Flavobacteriales bacterium]